MASRHKLEGCSSQCAARVEKLGQFVKAVAPCVDAVPDDAKQLLSQMALVRLQSIVEAYYRCLVSLGTFWDPHCVRAYVSRRRPDLASSIAGHTVEQLTSHGFKEVVFDDDAVRLKGIISALFSVSPFPDPSTEERCLDLAAVRNIIAHQVDAVSETNARTVRSRNVIIATTRIGAAQFYGLQVTSEFFAEVSSAVVGSFNHLENAISADPRFKLTL